MPQLNPEFFISQLFWLAVSFTFLFVFLWRISLPRIGSVLEKRHNKISEDLTKAEELQEKAQEIEKSINLQLANAKKLTNEKLKDALLKFEEKSSSELKIIDKELEEKVIDAEKRINENKENQMKYINDEMMSITKITSSKIASIDISDDDISSALKIVKGNLK